MSNNTYQIGLKPVEMKQADPTQQEILQRATITNFWFAWFAFNPDTDVYRKK